LKNVFATNSIDLSCDFATAPGQDGQLTASRVMISFVACSENASL